MGRYQLLGVVLFFVVVVVEMCVCFFLSETIEVIVWRAFNNFMINKLVSETLQCRACWPSASRLHRNEF